MSSGDAYAVSEHRLTYATPYKRFSKMEERSVATLRSNL